MDHAKVSFEFLTIAAMCPVVKGDDQDVPMAGRSVQRKDVGGVMPHGRILDDDGLVVEQHVFEKRLASSCWHQLSHAAAYVAAVDHGVHHEKVAVTVRSFRNRDAYDFIVDNHTHLMDVELIRRMRVHVGRIHSGHDLRSGIEPDGFEKAWLTSNDTIEGSRLNERAVGQPFYVPILAVMLQLELRKAAISLPAACVRVEHERLEFLPCGIVERRNREPSVAKAIKCHFSEDELKGKLNPALCVGADTLLAQKRVRW